MKKIVLEFNFEEVHDKVWDTTNLELHSIQSLRNDLDEDERLSLGEGISQSDYWQVDRWIDIQGILCGAKDRFYEDE